MLPGRPRPRCAAHTSASTWCERGAGCAPASHVRHDLRPRRRPAAGSAPGTALIDRLGRYRSIRRYGPAGSCADAVFTHGSFAQPPARGTERITISCGFCPHRCVRGCGFRAGTVSHAERRAFRGAADVCPQTVPGMVLARAHIHRWSLKGLRGLESGPIAKVQLVELSIGVRGA